MRKYSPKLTRPFHPMFNRPFLDSMFNRPSLDMTYQSVSKKHWVCSGGVHGWYNIRHGQPIWIGGSNTFVKDAIKVEVFSWSRIHWGSTTQDIEPTYHRWLNSFGSKYVWIWIEVEA